MPYKGSKQTNKELEVNEERPHSKHSTDLLELVVGTETGSGADCEVSPHLPGRTARRGETQYNNTNYCGAAVAVTDIPQSGSLHIWRGCCSQRYRINDRVEIEN